MTGAGPYAARGETVWHGATSIDRQDGTRSLRLGFPVCAINHDICAPAVAARQVAAGLNLIQRIAGIEAAARDAERLIDDMTRFAGQMALRDYALLNEVPARLRELIGWAAACRAEIAGTPLSGAGGDA